MNQQQVNKLLGILLLAFCVIGATWGILRQNSLKKKNKIGTCRTTAFTSNGRGNEGGIWIDYILGLNGEEYKGSSRYLTSEITSDDLQNFILHKTFPVAYNPSNPSVSSILITPKDFSRYGYPFPDSLKWVLQYFNEN